MLIYGKEHLTIDMVDIAIELSDLIFEPGEGISAMGHTVLCVHPNVFLVVRNNIDDDPRKFTIQKGR